MRRKESTISKEERYKIYKETLTLFRKRSKRRIFSCLVGGATGLCYCLRVANNKSNYSYFTLLLDFPELLKKRPDGKFSYEYWFANNIFGYYKRIRVIKKCIKETK